VNCTETNWDRHGEAAYKIFLALNIDFDGPSLDFLGSRKPANEGIKEQYPLKAVILPLLASFSWKRLQMVIGMLPITTSTSDELFSCINIDDFERPWTSKIRGFIDFCDLWLQRTLQVWTATKWLEIDWQCANRNCYRLSCISWALAQTSCLCFYVVGLGARTEQTDGEIHNVVYYDSCIVAGNKCSRVLFLKCDLVYGKCISLSSGMWKL